MALNASGPISFGGSTTGQSINLELNVSATALASINSTAFRTLAGVASGQISISSFYGKSNIQGWVGTYSYSVPTTTYYQGAYGVGFDSSNNIFVWGRLGAASSPIDSSTLIKVNSTGTLQGGITLTSGAYAADPDRYFGQLLTVDGSGNPYVAAVLNNRSGILKFNTSASSIDWGYYTDLAGQITRNGYDGAIVKDFSGNIWSTARGFDAGFNNITGYVKVNTGGSLLLSKYTTNNYYIQGPVAVDASGNFILNYGNRFWYKFNSDGTLSSTIGMTQNNTNRSVSVCDSSNNFYLASQAGGTFCILTKFDSSLTLQWSRQLSGYTNNGGPRNIIVGGDGNIYVCGGFSSAGQPGWIVKYNSSGTLQWQRQFYNANENSGVQGNIIWAIAYSSIGIAFAGQVVNNSGSSDPDKTQAIMGIIPLVGNGTGSYNPSGGSINITYTALSGTDAAYTFGDSTQTGSSMSNNSNWTSSTPGTTSAAGSAYYSSLA